MSKTEKPSSVSLEYSPQTFGPGTVRQRYEQSDIIEQGAHKRKRGGSQPRVLHVQDLTDEKSVTSMLLSQGEEYTSVLIKNQDEKPLREIKINGTHLRISDGITEAKFDFSGKQLVEEAPPTQPSFFDTIQLSFGEPWDLLRQSPTHTQPFEETVSMQESLRDETQLSFGEPWEILRQSSHTALPQEFPANVAAFLVDVASYVKDSQKNIPPEKICRLSTIFTEITNTSPTPDSL